uniref:SRCR domain-containing protein n=1 Tax=Pavo cristatus TaxID=9049 RepID=A0A8C9G7S4_PAVCR
MHLSSPPASRNPPSTKNQNVNPPLLFPEYTGFRLANSSTVCAGRVEVQVMGTWGTLCASRWDLSDAHVLCRHLGCGFARTASLRLCNTSLPKATGIMEDVGAVWSRRVRLVDGAGRCAGRVEIYYQGQWGTVCDDTWDMADADVVCRQLSCGWAVEVAGSARFGEGSGQIWLDGINCSGTEAALWDCRVQPWGQHDCGHKEDAGSWCPWGKDRCSGRVEVWHHGSWGTICDDSWDMQDAEVVCRQLGCGPAVSALAEAAYGEGTGPIWLEQVECRGTELSLQDCWAQPGDSGVCRHKEDLGLLTQVLPTVLCGAEQGPGHCPNTLPSPARGTIQVALVGDMCQGVPYYCTHPLSALFFSSAASPRMTASPPQTGKISSPGAGSSLDHAVTHSQGEESLYQGVKRPGRGARLLGMGRSCNVPRKMGAAASPSPWPPTPAALHDWDKVWDGVWELLSHGLNF